MLNRWIEFCQQLKSYRQHSAVCLALAALAAVLLWIGIGQTGLADAPPVPLAPVRTAAAEKPLPMGQSRQVPGAGAAARKVILTSPFAGTHVSRQALRQRETEPPALPAGMPQGRPGLLPVVKRPLCLTGIVRSRRGALAILSLGDQQLLLAEGETAAGITLLSLQDSAARVRDAAGERELMLEK